MADGIQVEVDLSKPTKATVTAHIREQCRKKKAVSPCISAQMSNMPKNRKTEIK
ncbi:MAG: hypothetical protein IJM10_04075 [Clostridia bacterium]|nr:hypothetical protein [Clostridia bacterium]